MPDPFVFKGALSDSGETASGPSASEFYHPTLPTCLLASHGVLTIVNGWNANRALWDMTDDTGDPTAAVRPLQMLPPPGPLVPIISAPGNGVVFGRGLKWRGRWKNSVTGEFSGLSQSPDQSWNLGVESSSGASYFGQKAHFAIATSWAPTGADTFQLFRNSTDEEGVWYLVAEDTFSTSTTLHFTDNFTDEEIFTAAEVVTVGQPSGPTIDEGLMYSVVKAYLHPTGRVWYYGIRRFAGYRSETNALTLTEGTNYVSVASPIPHMNLVGCRLKLTAASNGAVKEYRIAAIDSTLGFYTTEDIEPYLTAGTVYINVVDDRDSRWIWQAEPGKPWLIDPLKTMAWGHDQDDDVYAVFSLNGVTHVHTRRRLYRILNDYSDDPSLSSQAVVVSDEGIVGFEAGVSTPFGWVFVNQLLGVRVYDGSTTYALGGTGSPYESFLLQTQFSRIEPGALDDSRLFYDADHHTLYLSYVPSGSSSHEEALVFPVNDRVWRGPYRMRLTAAGVMRSGAADDQFILGDDQGSLIYPEYQSRDHLDRTTHTVDISSFVSVSKDRIWTVSGAAFDPDSDSRLRGAPIWFHKAAGDEWFHSTIAAVRSATVIETIGPPLDESQVVTQGTEAWAGYIGPVRWNMTTAYVDAGEPIQPKEFQQLRLRFRRGVSDTFKVGVSLDDSGTYVGERSSASEETEASVAVAGLVYDGVDIQRTARCFTIRLKGTAWVSEPQITNAVADIEVRSGA